MSNRLEILNANYWQHYKAAQELAGFLDLNHPRRVAIEIELNKLLTEIHKLSK